MEWGGHLWMRLAAAQERPARDSSRSKYQEEEGKASRSSAIPHTHHKICRYLSPKWDGGSPPLPPRLSSHLDEGLDDGQSCA